MNVISIDSPTEEKILWAERTFEKIGPILLKDKGIVRDLELFKEANKATWDKMKALGIPQICSECDKTGGSCCRKRIDRHYDAVMLLINKLLGVQLPHRALYQGACFFLGPTGCRLWAREVICINYLCEKITAKIPHNEIVSLQKIACKEMDVLFFLQERLKKLLLGFVP